MYRTGSSFFYMMSDMIIEKQIANDQQCMIFQDLSLAATSKLFTQT